MYKKSRVSFNSRVDFPRFTSVLFRVFLLTISGQVYDKDTRISFCSFSPRFSSPSNSNYFSLSLRGLLTRSLAPLSSRLFFKLARPTQSTLPSALRTHSVLSTSRSSRCRPVCSLPSFARSLSTLIHLNLPRPSFVCVTHLASCLPRIWLRVRVLVHSTPSERIRPTFPFHCPYSCVFARSLSHQTAVAPPLLPVQSIPRFATRILTHALSSTFTVEPTLMA